MKNRDRRIPVAIAAVTAALVVVCVSRPPGHAGRQASVTWEPQFLGSGEAVPHRFAGGLQTSPVALARFWYSKRINDPSYHFKAWVNWGDPQHQDPRDENRGFWARVRLDLDHSADPKWCYLVENWRPDSDIRIATPVYHAPGSYVAYVKIWDAEKRALKPSICLDP